MAKAWKDVKDCIDLVETGKFNGQSNSVIVLLTEGQLVIAPVTANNLSQMTSGNKKGCHKVEGD